MNREMINVIKIFEREKMTLEEKKVFLMIKVSDAIKNKKYDKVEIYKNFLKELEDQEFN